MPDLVERLRAAGCVFAEDEAVVLREAGRDDADLERMTAARVAGEPLEYVVGFADFCGVRVVLDRGVFIPRRRSEFLVRTAAELSPRSATVLDLCCGSGALGLALAKLRPDVEVHAADIDPSAVRNARRNLPQVYESDLFESIPLECFDLVLANVPYVPSDQLDTMPIEAREHEPAGTHDGGVDGLDILRRVLVAAPDRLKAGGRVLAELADHQVSAVMSIVTDLHLETVWSDEHETAVLVAARSSPSPNGDGDMAHLVNSHPVDRLAGRARNGRLRH